ncbi:oxidoreductase, short chain dehydrogenase/reductase family protein [Toxoplasma gondii MAS]|uniref:Oxidoreductase, short chain dehydrogenase/reductase family protein n=2 Tax=Toxoplasma gondii TaxID=5811 RepID=A0A086QQV3_TOXGO|nr:oxidoreductase, short chain dehydrogenase/reductase family protein [Toxoplasma gondii MAS]PUA89050.1 oxidoreductase, short chain dehydrogenase/reductase family protein [Toxoplasma gondii TgCATBr9]
MESLAWRLCVYTLTWLAILGDADDLLQASRYKRDGSFLVPPHIWHVETAACRWMIHQRPNVFRRLEADLRTESAFVGANHSQSWGDVLDACWSSSSFVSRALCLGVASFRGAAFALSAFHSWREREKAQERKLAVLVTGSSSGIGLQVTRLLLALDFYVIGTRLHSEDPWRVFEEICGGSSRLLLLPMDVTNAEDVARAVEATKKFLRENDVSGLYALVNCAGIWNWNFIQTQSPQETEKSLKTWRELFDVNLLGAVRVMHAFLPLMQARAVFVGSILGRMSSPGQTAYCASKAAVRLLAEGARSDARDAGVNVVLVAFLAEVRVAPAQHVKSSTCVFAKETLTLCHPGRRRRTRGQVSPRHPRGCFYRPVQSSAGARLSARANRERNCRLHSLCSDAAHCSLCWMGYVRMETA